MRNALAATPGGVRITVRVEAQAAPAAVRLIVRDTGPGIPPEMAARLFKPFFTTRASEGGTGLVRTIVAEHGGTITATFDHSAELIVSFPPHQARVS